VNGELAESLAPTLHDEVTRVLFALALVLTLARLAGHAANRMKLPAVLGELTAGVLLGNLTLLHVDALAWLRDDVVLDVMAEVGVVLLLFSVGLQSELKALAAVGASALRVAVLGVVAPFLLGVGVGKMLLPAADPLVHVFIGATLCATSVGITARVLDDLGLIDSREARIILSAAVVDDVLGLLLLAVVTALALQQASGAPLEASAIVLPLAKAALFFGVAALLGLYVIPRVFPRLQALGGRAMLLAAALVFCFGLGALANLVGLAAIVGSFAAGVALDDAQIANADDGHGLEVLIEPLVGVFAPLFFVVVGMRVELALLATPAVLTLGVALTVVAVLGKQLCGLGVREPGLARSAVGIGMIPRGEVGLIFAGVGATTLVMGRPVIDSSTYAALILMVFATTLITPPMLARSLARPDAAEPPGAD
jgi:Kef-type K+ transport system membrane component KefB